MSADIIHEPLFESAVAKLQGSDFTLTPAEKSFVDSAAAESDEADADADLSFPDETLDDAAA